MRAYFYPAERAGISGVLRYNDCVIKPEPPYIKQEQNSTCSIAVLRMVLAMHGQDVSEQELVAKLSPDYGDSFLNIWSASIAMMTCKLHIHTTLYADWSLLDPTTFSVALAEYTESPENFDFMKYEKPKDNDKLPENLSIAYADTFKAAQLGCNMIYEPMSVKLIEKLLSEGNIIQTFIKLLPFYGKRTGHHSILIYDFDGINFIFHDPSYGKASRVSQEKLTKSIQDVGAALVYKI